MPIPGVEELLNGWMDGDGLFPEATAMLTDQAVRPPQRVRPGEEARKLYRELARKARPDLAQEEAERVRREETHRPHNAHYARGDAAQLRELAEEWAAGPVPERRPSRGEELYARLEWLDRRKGLRVLAKELEESAMACSGSPRTTPTGCWTRSPNSWRPRCASGRRSWRGCSGRTEPPGGCWVASGA
ncbi:hypothetical protein SHIRM173S_00028 [Streptomyces hirsutus]